jgi:hypothetical protein
MIKFNGTREEAYQASDKITSKVTIEELVNITKLSPVAKMKKKQAT